MTICVLSVERYIAICHPLRSSKYKLSSQTRALKIISGIWLIGLVSGFFIGIQHSVKQKASVVTSNNHPCDFDHKSLEIRLVLHSFLFFFLPTLLICAMYTLIAISLKRSANTINNGNFVTNASKRRVPKILCKSFLLFSIN